MALMNARPWQSSPLDPLAPFMAIARRVDGMASWSVGHSGRVSLVAAEVARVACWSPADIARVGRTAELHDIGKLCVSEETLGAPGHLDSAARAEVELHAALGANMLARVLEADEVGWVRHHHEGWDDGGYPNGLCGDEIPLGGKHHRTRRGVGRHADAEPSTHPTAVSRRGMGRVPCASGTQFAPWAVAAPGYAICVVELMPADSQ